MSFKEFSLYLTQMTSSDWISICGSLITLASVYITIKYANKAKKYKEQLQFDVRKRNLTNIVEKLKRIQDEIIILPKFQSRRGTKVDNAIKTIRIHFNFTLNLLDSDGLDSEIRDYISKAQKLLNTYEKAQLDEVTGGTEIIKITDFIQKAIGKSHTRILALEKDM